MKSKKSLQGVAFSAFVAVAIFVANQKKAKLYENAYNPGKAASTEIPQNIDGSANKNAYKYRGFVTAGY